jgi:hypothetical protein
MRFKVKVYAGILPGGDRQCDIHPSRGGYPRWARYTSNEYENSMRGIKKIFAEPSFSQKLTTLKGIKSPALSEASREFYGTKLWFNWLSSDG